MIWCWEAIGRFLCVHLHKHNQHLSNVWSSHGNQWGQIREWMPRRKGPRILGSSNSSISVIMWLPSPCPQGWAKIPKWGQDVLLMLEMLISGVQHLWMIQTLSCEFLLLLPKASSRKWDVSVWFSYPWELLTAVLLAAFKNSAHMCLLNTLFPFSPSLGNIIQTFQDRMIL